MTSLALELAELFLQVRIRQPLIHYVPNLVTANDAANVLLAVGASPILAVAPEEVAEIRADALVLNLGTPTAERLRAMDVAAEAAMRRQIPIVLDPVGVGTTSLRFAAVHRLLTDSTVCAIRLHGGEAAALLGSREASRIDGPDEPVASGMAQELARQYRCVAAITGARDVVSDGTRSIHLANGAPLLRRLTGTGCMLSGVVGACLVDAADPLLATAAAVFAFGVAGELAAAQAQGPGSLRARLFDTLYSLDEAILLHYGKVTWL